MTLWWFFIFVAWQGVGSSFCIQHVRSQRQPGGGHRGSQGGEDGRCMALNCGFARRKSLTLSRTQLLFPAALPSLASFEAQISG